MAKWQFLDKTRATVNFNTIFRNLWTGHGFQKNAFLFGLSELNDFLIAVSYLENPKNGRNNGNFCMAYSKRASNS